jgi:Zn-dependent M28 family amino/carboxypeptidase
VAVLLEVAELMKAEAPPIGVDLVFFDAEDLGRADHPEEFSLGSQGYARRLPPPGDPRRPVAAFLFDMVGDRDLAIHPEMNSVQHASNLVDMVLEGAKATGAAGFRTAPRYTLTDDHIPLIEAGLPTADLIDFDYPAWHTHRDLPDQVSAASLAEVAGVAAWLVYRSPLARP